MWKRLLPLGSAAIVIIGITMLALFLPTRAMDLNPTSSSNITLYVTPIIPPVVTNGSGATSVTDTTARLNGEITEDGNDNPTVVVYWGQTDGTDNATAWSNNATVGVEPLGTFYYDSSNLTASTTYYYRMYASNAAGSDWADASANFTTSATLAAPTNFTLTDLGGHIVTANWTTGTGATYTLIRISRSDYPGTVAADQWLFYGDTESANITGWPLDTQVLYASAWSYAADNTTYSSTYATANIGGEGMTDIAEAITGVSTTVDSFLAVAQLLAGSLFVLGMFGIALWYSQRAGVKGVILMIISGLVTFFIGVTWLTDYQGVSVAMMGLALFEFFEAVVIALSAGGPSKGLSQFRGIYNNIRGWF